MTLANSCQVGAKLVDHLDPTRCDVVAGVKEPLAENLAVATRTTHLGFFHTHKGQRYNLPLLSNLLESRSRIVDYELLTDRAGAGAKRTTGFGKLAGFSGMADGLAALGTKLLASKGVATPFLHLRRPLQAGTVDKVVKGLRKCAKAIRENGIPHGAGPVRTGWVAPLDVGVHRLTDSVPQLARSSSRCQAEAKSGRARNKFSTNSASSGSRTTSSRSYRLPQVSFSRGLCLLSNQKVAEFGEQAATDTRQIYACHLELQDYLVHKEGRSFSREEYRQHPERFESTFHEKVERDC